MQKQEKAKGFREGSQVADAFFRQGHLGGWRDTLTPAQVDAIVERHGEEMAKHGYLP